MRAYWWWFILLMVFNNSEVEVFTHSAEFSFRISSVKLLDIGFLGFFYDLL